MLQIPTLYTNYQELLLDLDILGKILSESAIKKDELKVLLFEEYKITHPLPTLEDKRYELSDLVSSDYHISYGNEVELAENEYLIDLGIDSSSDNFEFEGNIVVPQRLKDYLNYSINVTDSIREQLIQEFLTSDLDELSDEDSRIIEENFNTVEDKSVVYIDEETNDEDYCSYEDNEDNSYNEEDNLNEEGYESDEDDYSYNDDSDLEDDNYNIDEDYSVDDEDYNEEDYNYSSEDEDYSSEDEDYSSEDEDYSSEDEDYSSEDDEEYTEDGDYSYEEEYIEDDDYSYKEDDSNTSTVSDNLEDVEVDFIPTPIDIVNSNKQSKSEVIEQPKNVVNREEEPKDLREFIRKHPRCEVSFALQYFSRKEIEKNIMLGKVIKKGSKLHI